MDPSESGLDAPAITIEFRTKDGGEPVRITIGSKRGSQYYARVEGDAQVVLVEADKIDKLPDALDDFEKTATTPSDTGPGAEIDIPEE